MFHSLLRDRKLTLLVVALLSLVILMALIWRHYDLELQRIDERMNELKSTI